MGTGGAIANFGPQARFRGFSNAIGNAIQRGSGSLAGVRTSKRVRRSSRTRSSLRPHREHSILTSSNAPDLWFARTASGYDHCVTVDQGGASIGSPRIAKSSELPTSKTNRYTRPGNGASGGEEDVDPSDHDQNDPHNGAPGGGHGPTYANAPLGEGWLRSVVENSSEIVTIVDPDGTLRCANPAWGRALGPPPTRPSAR